MKMSTYLLAIVISPFDYDESVTESDPPVEVSNLEFVRT